MAPFPGFFIRKTVPGLGKLVSVWPNVLKLLYQVMLEQPNIFSLTKSYFPIKLSAETVRAK